MGAAREEEREAKILNLDDVSFQGKRLFHSFFFPFLNKTVNKNPFPPKFLRYNTDPL